MERAEATRSDASAACSREDVDGWPADPRNFKGDSNNILLRFHLSKNAWFCLHFCRILKLVHQSTFIYKHWQWLLQVERANASQSTVIRSMQVCSHFSWNWYGIMKKEKRITEVGFLRRMTKISSMNENICQGSQNIMEGLSSSSSSTSRNQQVSIFSFLYRRILNLWMIPLLMKCVR